MPRFILVLLAMLVLSACTGTGGNDGSPPPQAQSPQTSEKAPRGSVLRRACDLPPEWVRYIYRGWDPLPTRNKDLVIVPAEGNYVGTFIGTSHSGPYGYLQDVPLTFFGPGFIRPLGRIETDREITVADIAPTVARLLDLDFTRSQSRPITEVLRDDRDSRPKVIVTASIDGGGWNVLRRWPDAWPRLRRLMEEGANIDEAVVGSSPSITPSIHTNMSTGLFPRQHGVTAIAVRAPDGSLVGGFSRAVGNSGGAVADPTINLRKSTIADEWDRVNGNSAKVAMIGGGNYALGLLGQGSAFDGGDKDILALQAGDAWATNPEYYSMPDYVNDDVPGPDQDLLALDRMDGRADGIWRGHELGSIDATPALAGWQHRTIEALLERERFGRDEVTDLFYIQYKSPDAAGHKWNMIAPEQREVLRSVDDAIGSLIRYLDENVGRNEYVVIITADHGQQPLEAGGWPISRGEIRRDVAREFDKLDNGQELILRTSATSYFMRGPELERNEVTPGEIASFLTEYTIGDNIPDGDDPPKGYEKRLDERVFAAVFPARQIPKIARCTGALEP